ncbi:hypothetical protein DSECCO2_428940 [anaerobic digester metagenome]
MEIRGAGIAHGVLPDEVSQAFIDVKTAVDELDGARFQGDQGIQFTFQAFTIVLPIQIETAFTTGIVGR